MLLWSAAVALLFNAKISAWTSVAIALVINEPFSSAKAVTSLTSAVAVAQFPQKVWVNGAKRSAYIKEPAWPMSRASPTACSESEIAAAG